MSARKQFQQQDLNVSGFSPLKLNIQSPGSNAKPSPATKDYGILEAIDSGKEKLISSHDKWRLANSNGLQCITAIHGIKEKARKSSDSNYPAELENYCKKLASMQAVHQSVINQVSTLIVQMRSSISILTAMNDSGSEMKCQIATVEKFLCKLRSLYEQELNVKNFVIENIAHANSSEESHLLLASWSCSSFSNEIHKLILQLKISPADYRWCT